MFIPPQAQVGGSPRRFRDAPHDRLRPPSSVCVYIYICIYIYIYMYVYIYICV